MSDDAFSDAIREFEHNDETYKMADLTVLEEQGLCDLEKLPVSIRILLESVLRNADGEQIDADSIRAAASWEPDVPDAEVPFTVSRVVLQDLTGVPAVVDLAALRSAADRKGVDPTVVEPEVPCDLVIDHSVQVDHFGSDDATRRTSRSSTSETKSDIVRSSGHSRPSRTSRSSPQEPGSSTRSISSTSDASSTSAKLTATSGWSPTRSSARTATPR